MKRFILHYPDRNIDKEFIEGEWYLCTYDLKCTTPGDFSPNDIMLYRIKEIYMKLGRSWIMYSECIHRDGSYIKEGGEITNGNIDYNLVHINLHNNLLYDQAIQAIKDI